MADRQYHAKNRACDRKQTDILGRAMRDLVCRRKRQYGVRFDGIDGIERGLRIDAARRASRPVSAAEGGPVLAAARAGT